MSEVLRQPITLDDVRARRDGILRLMDQYGASNVRVFGSVARGESIPESDVDLLVTARKGTSIFDLVGLWLDLQELLGCDVSLVTDDEQPGRERFLRRILKDAVLL